ANSVAVVVAVQLEVDVHMRGMVRVCTGPQYGRKITTGGGPQRLEKRLSLGSPAPPYIDASAIGEDKAHDVDGDAGGVRARLIAGDIVDRAAIEAAGRNGGERRAHIAGRERAQNLPRKGAEAFSHGAVDLRRADDGHRTCR